MKLNEKWFTAITENQDNKITIITGRDNLIPFLQSGKYKEYVQITWKYEGNMPDDQLAEQMETMQENLRKNVETDKLAILAAIYTEPGERNWIYYTRTVPIFCQRMNEALSQYPSYPIQISATHDPQWEEYLEIYEMKDEEDDDQ